MARYATTQLTEPEVASLIEQAKAMLAAGSSWSRIRCRLGPSEDWFKRRLVEGFVEKDRAKREKSKANAMGRVNVRRYRRGSGKIKNFQDTVREDAAARLAEIPEDTRDLTGRMCGDPLFERSALAKKQVGA